MICLLNDLTDLFDIHYAASALQELEKKSSITCISNSEKGPQVRTDLITDLVRR